MIGEVVSSILKSLDGLFTSDKEREDARNKLVEIITTYDNKSQEINKIEAAGNTLQRGWRPLLAYICVFIFAYVNVIQPIWDLPMPKNGFSNVTEMLYYLLGYSGLRTLEKVKGVIK